jgi:hypothetical protein
MNIFLFYTLRKVCGVILLLNNKDGRDVMIICSFFLNFCCYWLGFIKEETTKRIECEQLWEEMKWVLHEKQKWIR